MPGVILQERKKAISAVNNGLAAHPADPRLLALHLSLIAQHNGISSAPLDAACVSATIALANAGLCIPSCSGQSHALTHMSLQSGDSSTSVAASGAAFGADAAISTTVASNEGLMDGTYDQGCLGSAEAYVAWLALLSVEHKWPAAFRRLQQGEGR